MANSYQLNPEQQAAVKHTEGPLLVLAGAGSGKTRVIIHRIAHLLSLGVRPQQILGVTFTNKAALEMATRLRSLVGKAGSGVMLSTFHALALQILRAEAAAVDLQPNFCIFDTSDQLSLVRELMRQVKVADRRLDAYRILQIILKHKRQGATEVAIDFGDDYEFAAYELYPRYLSQMRAFAAVDFDDLMLLAGQALAQPDIAERWARRFTYLLVDEYQDTSPEQLGLIQILAQQHHNICAVGDDDQAIYAWRGAQADTIVAFSRHYPQAQQIVLSQNYRSTGAILEVANAVISRNSQRIAKELWSSDGMGEAVEWVACAHCEDEAEFVAETFSKLHLLGASYSDMAVLYRSNTQSRLFEEILAQHGIPFRVVGGQSFYDRKEVKDALAYLTLLVAPDNDLQLRRVINVPPRGIGPTSLEKLSQAATAQNCALFTALAQPETAALLPKAAHSGRAAFLGVVAEYQQALAAAPLDAVPKVIGEYFAALNLAEAVLQADDPPSILEQRLGNLRYIQGRLERFVELCDGGSGTAVITDFLRGSTLGQQDSPQDEARHPAVSVMTLHSAKGLEFPYVCLVGLEEDLLPHKRTLAEGGDIAEERRLCYVGITRARKRLWLTYAKQRLRHGRMELRTPSRFITELPEGLNLMYRDRASDVGAAADNSEQLAQAFFQKMRQQLGMGDDRQP